MNRHATIALHRLIERFRGSSIAECGELALSLGFHPDVGRAARRHTSYHHQIGAGTYLGLCAGVGINCLTGENREPRIMSFFMSWHMLGAAIRVRRNDTGLSLQGMADAIGISKPTLYRLEAGQPLSIESLLTVCTFINVSPEQYAKCFTIADPPRETTPTALKSQEVTA